MSGEIIKEWHFWLVSVATGAFMAFAYDVIRLFRRLVRHGRFAVDLEDILYWTACFGLSFTLLYYGNNGVIRFAAVFGAAVGMLIYLVTVGRFFVRAGFFIIDKTIGALFRLIRRIIRKIGQIRKPIKRFSVKIYYKWKHFFHSFLQKTRLTRTSNRHKMKVHRHRAAEDEKGEMADGRKKTKRTKTGKKKQKKDARVSARPK